MKLSLHYVRNWNKKANTVNRIGDRGRRVKGDL